MKLLTEILLLAQPTFQKDKAREAKEEIVLMHELDVAMKEFEFWTMRNILSSSKDNSTEAMKYALQWQNYIHDLQRQLYDTDADMQEVLQVHRDIAAKITQTVEA